MPKFTFIAEHQDFYGKPNGHKVTTEFTVDSLDNVLENFDLFLRGAGFMPPPGMLDYVVDEYGDHGGGSYPEMYESTEVLSTKSEHYFDTERNK